MAKMKRTKSAAPVIRKSRGDKFASWMFLVPTMIFLGITALLPLLYSLYLSFFRLKLNLPNAVPEFIGFGNYIKMFSDPTLLTSTGNTLLFAVVSVALEVVIGLFLAMALCSDKMWARILKALQAVSSKQITGLTAHVFRHNYCTNLCYQIPKVSIEKIAELLGDTEKMVLEVYNHMVMEKEDATGAVEDALSF